MTSRASIALLLGAALLAGCGRAKPAADVASEEASAPLMGPPAPEAEAPPPAPAPELPPDPLRALIGQKVTLTGVAVSTPAGAALRGDGLYVAIANQDHWQGYAGSRVQVTGILEERPEQAKARVNPTSTSPRYLIRSAIWSPLIEPTKPRPKKGAKPEAKPAASGDKPVPPKPKTALELFNTLAQAEGKPLMCDGKAAETLSKVKLVDGRLPNVFLNGSSYALKDYLDAVLAGYGLTWTANDAGYAIASKDDPPH